MILKMEKLFLYGHVEDKQAILNALMGLSCVQMIPPEELEQSDSTVALSPEQAMPALQARDIPAVYETEQKLSEIASALAILKDYEKKAGLFSKKAMLDYQQLGDFSNLEEALRKASGVRGISANIAEVKSSIAHCQFVKTALEPWRSFDLPLESLSTKTAVVTFYTLSNSCELSALSETLAGEGTVLEEVSADKDVRYVALLSPKTPGAQLTTVLREAGALLVTLPAESGTVAENIAQMDRQLLELDRNQEALHQSLREEAGDTALLKATHDRLSVKIASERARQNLLLTQQTFFAAGWLAEKDRSRVEKLLEPFDCYLLFKAPAPEEDPPVRFKNNALVEPFEVITEMYGFPAPKSVDPNPFIAPFFFLFFGMMLSDAGYGIILMVAGFIMSKKTKKGTFGNKLFSLIGLCGISTVIWGAIYGGWFGDVVTVIAETFFGAEIVIPALINPLQEPMTIMIMSFLFGAVHLFVGMGIRAYLLIRRGKALDALFDIGFWYLILIGLPMMLLGGTFVQVGMWLAIVGAIGLILTQGRDKKNIFMRLMSGIMSLYDITGYFSDVLSYSRILALGLATGVIASVVNILATLPGANLLGLVFFVVIFVGGHVFNLGINALGSYVHTSRLQYVEFFGKFFEGGGRPFSPLSPSAKYHVVNIKED